MIGGWEGMRDGWAKFCRVIFSCTLVQEARLSGPSLAGHLVFPLVRGHTRGGCFHYIWWVGPFFRVG